MVRSACSWGLWFQCCPWIWWCHQRSKTKRERSPYGKDSWNMCWEELSIAWRTSQQEIQRSRSSARQPSEEPVLGGSFLPGLGQFSCNVRGIPMGWLLWLLAGTWSKASRCNSSVHSSNSHWTTMLGRTAWRRMAWWHRLQEIQKTCSEARKGFVRSSWLWYYVGTTLWCQC